MNIFTRLHQSLSLDQRRRISSASCEPVERVDRFEMERHFGSADEIALGIELGQKFHLVEIAIHVVQPGDPVAGTMFQPAPDRVEISRPFGGGSGRNRVLASHEPGQFAPAIGRKREDGGIGAGLPQFALGEAIPAHDDLGADLGAPPSRSPASSSVRVLAQIVW